MVIRATPKTETDFIHAHSHARLPRHLLIGYWHNWQNSAAPFMRLAHVSPKFDMINVAFAQPDPQSLGQMVFHLYRGTTPDQFKADIAYLHSLGKKVIISVGGANGSLALTDQNAQENFVESMSSIIEEYDFDGIDINLEGKIKLDWGDTDFTKPTSPSITHLISAIKKIQAWFGPNFLLSLAPETTGLQGGYQTYNGLSGSYIPIIHALREIISYVHVQHYNSAPMLALDGQMYAQGTADFHVAMADMLLQGFPVNQHGAHFTGLKPQQIVIGLPAFSITPSDGYTNPEEIQKALTTLTTGQVFGGRYRLQEPFGYPDFRGVMTWSINWDAVNCQQLSTSTRRLLDRLP